MERITSAKNPAVRQLRALRDGKGRQESGLFLVEGEVMLSEALNCGLEPKLILADEEHAQAAERFAAEGVRACVAPRSILEAVCDTRTPQGVCGAFTQPAPIPLESAPARIVALDGTQDPGNVGTIWRTADAAGFQAVLLGAGCADALSPKVQRAAMGSGFRVPFLRADDLAAALSTLAGRGYSILASDLHGQDFYRRPDPGERFVLVIGNEARGVSEAVLAAATARVRLPMRGGAESLNAAVAAGIMMYEMMREE